MDFQAQLQVNDRGRVLPDAQNVYVLLTNDFITSTLRFNEFSNMVELGGVTLKDSDIFRIRREFNRTYQVLFPKELLLDAVVAVAEERCFHPIRDYLKTLTWDGTQRLSSLFGAYFITPEKKPLYEAASRCFGIGAVARVYQPGAKLDTYPVLEGKQGIYKSSGIAALVPHKDWFSDTRIDLNNKDAYIALNGKWIYEVAELDSFRGVGSTRLKSFVSSAADSYRPPYGTFLRNFPRQTVFVATTNDSDYVSDSTGERRKWPIPVNSVDIDAIRRDRDQLWAEAVVAYQAGEQWYLDDAFALEMAEAAQERREPNPFEDQIIDGVRHKLSTMANTPTADLSFLTAAQIYEAAGFNSASESPQKRKAISDTLRHLDFKPGTKRRVNGKPSNVWLVPNSLRAEAEAKREAVAKGGITQTGQA